MSILLFLAVWLATFAACWFGLARVWPGGYRPIRNRDGSLVIVGLARRRILKGETVSLADGLKPFGGARRWAPYVATVVAFAADWIVL